MAKKIFIIILLICCFKAQAQVTSPLTQITTDLLKTGSVGKLNWGEFNIKNSQTSSNKAGCGTHTEYVTIGNITLELTYDCNGKLIAAQLATLAGNDTGGGGGSSGTSGGNTGSGNGGNNNTPQVNCFVGNVTWKQHPTTYDSVCQYIVMADCSLKLIEGTCRPRGTPTGGNGSGTGSSPNNNNGTPINNPTPPPFNNDPPLILNNPNTPSFGGGGTGIGNGGPKTIEPNMDLKDDGSGGQQLKDSLIINEEECDSIYKKHNKKIDSLINDARQADIKFDSLRKYAINGGIIEYRFSFGKDSLTNTTKTTNILTDSSSYSVSGFYFPDSSKYDNGLHIHLADGYMAPSITDFYSLLNRFSKKKGATQNTEIIPAADSSIFALLVTDSSKAIQFLSDFPKYNNIGTEMGFRRNTELGDNFIAFYEGYFLLTQNSQDAFTYATAFVLNKFQSGLSLFKSPNLNLPFERIIARTKYLKQTDQIIFIIEKCN